MQQGQEHGTCVDSALTLCTCVAEPYRLSILWLNSLAVKAPCSHHSQVTAHPPAKANGAQSTFTMPGLPCQDSQLRPLRLSGISCVSPADTLSLSPDRH